MTVSPTTTLTHRARPSSRFSDPGAWPLVALFLMLPLWWALGLSGVILPLLALPMVASIALRRRLHVPRGFGWYLLFLVWCALSATQLATPRQGGALAYRGALYVSAGLLFLALLNLPREQIPASRIVRLMAGFFAIVVVGGYVGMLVPGRSFETLAQALVPASLLHDDFVRDLVSAATSSGRAFAAYPIHRPEAPFIYTNEWGAAYAMSLPFALGAVGYARTRVGRDMMVLLIGMSVFPLVFSLNRGAWLSAGVASLYAAVRLTRGRNARLVKVLAVGAIAVALVMFATPLGDIVAARLSNGFGDTSRRLLYESSVELVSESPVFGHGAPVQAEGTAAVGTHGQLWTVVVSQGIPGVILFVGWLLWAFVRARRRLPPAHPGDRQARLWCEVVLFTALIQLPYYDLLPWGLSMAMVAAAVAWREEAADAPGRMLVARQAGVVTAGRPGVLARHRARPAPLS